MIALVIAADELLLVLRLGQLGQALEATFARIFGLRIASHANLEEGPTESYLAAGCLGFGVASLARDNDVLVIQNRRRHNRTGSGRRVISSMLPYEPHRVAHPRIRAPLRPRTT